MHVSNNHRRALGAGNLLLGMGSVDTPYPDIDYMVYNVNHLL